MTCQSQPGKHREALRRGESGAGAVHLIKAPSNPLWMQDQSPLKYLFGIEFDLQLWNCWPTQNLTGSPFSKSVSTSYILFFFWSVSSLYCLKNILTQNVEWLWWFSGCLRRGCSTATKCAATVCFSLFYLEKYFTSYDEMWRNSKKIATVKMHSREADVPISILKRDYRLYK